MRRMRHAYLELARLSNGPTIISNVLVGAAIALHGSDLAFADLPWLTILIIALAMLLMYVAGMAMNDLVDAEVDREERPKRPIPSGRISRRAALTFITICIALALALTAACGIATFVLAITLLAAITAYNLTHKRHGASVILMGVCRGLVYLTSAAAIAWPLDPAIALPPAIAMTVYVAIVTVIARGEATDRLGLSRRLSIGLIAVALAPVLLIFPDDADSAAYVIIAGLALLGWLIAQQRHLLIRRPQLKPAVMGWLAAISLLDTFYLALLDRPALAFIAGGCFLATVAGHRKIAGT